MKLHHVFAPILLLIVLLGLANAQTSIRWTQLRMCEHHHFQGKCHSLEPMSSGCRKVPLPIYRQVSSYRVTNGCCTFYLTDDCKLRIFSATNREDATLDGKHNDAIQAYRCWFDCQA
ncbi:hypothetical protein BZA05DRAFT_415605 [Tricharina praecox]|uniref:uncharacterized protein n=1 Tax=Tricharina praecox TaxID=43433 RepID=UPI00221F2AFE|nr:uncharacterized protein BZA05DRAFT_415605 [Tricharina praecox]KAI5856882.1 hypothetical protein BZA05DRAFT_415605 [Tricharina praecox]